MNRVSDVIKATRPSSFRCGTQTDDPLMIPARPSLPNPPQSWQTFAAAPHELFGVVADLLVILCGSSTGRAPVAGLAYRAQHASMHAHSS